MARCGCRRWMSDLPAQLVRLAQLGQPGLLGQRDRQGDWCWRHWTDRRHGGHRTYRADGCHRRDRRDQADRCHGGDRPTGPTGPATCQALALPSRLMRPPMVGGATGRPSSRSRHRPASMTSGVPAQPWGRFYVMPERQHSAARPRSPRAHAGHVVQRLCQHHHIWGRRAFIGLVWEGSAPYRGRGGRNWRMTPSASTSIFAPTGHGNPFGRSSPPAAPFDDRQPSSAVADFGVRVTVNVVAFLWWSGGSGNRRSSKLQAAAAAAAGDIIAQAHHHRGAWDRCQARRRRSASSTAQWLGWRYL